MEINWEDMLQVATSVVAAAALLTAVTPNKWDNVVVKILRQVLNVLALNVANAKNEEKKS